MINTSLYSEESEQLRIRFGIFAIPTIYLLLKGTFYEYPLRKLSPTSINDILTFLKDYTSLASNRGQIPEDASSPLRKLWLMMQTEIAEEGLVDLLLMKDEFG